MIIGDLACIYTSLTAISQRRGHETESAMTQQDSLLCAYLIVGPDQLKRDAALARLKARLDTSFVDFNLDEREAKSFSDPNELLNSLNLMPFQSRYRLVIIHNASQLAQTISEAIISYLGAPNPSCILCLEAEKLAKNTRLYKAIQKQDEKAIVSCEAPKRGELTSYVQKLARSYNLRFDADALREFISRVGSSTSQIDNQLRSLAASHSASPQISLKDVLSFVPQTAEINPWSFVDALSRRDAAAALRMYRSMQKPDLVFLSSIMNTRIRELICAKALDERGSSYTLAQELGKQAWQVKNHNQWARHFTSNELGELLREGCKLSRVIRSSHDSDSAFIAYILKFAH